MRNIAFDIKENHPEVKYVFDVSWIRALPIYQSLMPPEMNKTAREYREDPVYSLNYYGQFYKSDGTLNLKRVAEFRRTWKFPIQPVLSICDVEDFLKMYLG